MTCLTTVLTWKWPGCLDVLALLGFHREDEIMTAKQLLVQAVENLKDTPLQMYLKQLLLRVNVEDIINTMCEVDKAGQREIEWMKLYRSSRWNPGYHRPTLCVLVPVKQRSVKIIHMKDHCPPSYDRILHQYQCYLYQYGNWRQRKLPLKQTTSPWFEIRKGTRERRKHEVRRGRIYWST